MAEDTIGFLMKVHVMRNVASFFGVEAPSSRELKLQIANLDKLQKAYSKKYVKKLKSALDGSASVEEIRRKMASDRHRLALQSRHVDDVFSRVVEEIHLKVYPNAKPVVRKGFRMKARKFTGAFNRRLNEDVSKLRADRYARALEAIVGLDKRGLKS